jgi:hypothetical protein
MKLASFIHYFITRKINWSWLCSMIILFVSSSVRNNMDNLELIRAKEELEVKLVNVFRVYITKYMTGLFEDASVYDKAYKQFQRELVRIALWNEDKKAKKYAKFLRWVESRFEMAPQELELAFHTWRSLSLEVVQRNMPLPSRECNLQNVYWKILKRCARYFYETPHAMENKHVFFQDIQDIIKGQLALYALPLNHVLDHLEGLEERKHQNNQEEGLENHHITTSHLDQPKHTHDTTSGQSVMDSSNQETKLAMIPSDEFAVQYYNEENKPYIGAETVHQDNKTKINTGKASTDWSEEDDVKMITIPKYRKYNPYNA